MSYVGRVLVCLIWLGMWTACSTMESPDVSGTDGTMMSGDDAGTNSGVDSSKEPMADLGPRPEPSRGLKHAPRPIHPAADWNVTDIALSFRWRRQVVGNDQGGWSSVGPHRVQLDDHQSFGSPALDVVQGAPVATYPDDAPLFERWVQMTLMPKTVFPAGRYFWRVRAEGPDNAEWSDPIGFTINAEHAHAPLVRPIGPSNPLFTFDMFFGDGSEGILARLSEIHLSFPESLQGLVAFAVHNEHIGTHPSDGGLGVTFTEFLSNVGTPDVPLLIKCGGPDKDFQQFPDLAELEQIFKTQPNVIGLVQGETFWDYIDGVDDPTIYARQVQWYRRSFKLAAKYGRYVILGNGNDEHFSWAQFLGDEDGERAWQNQTELQELAANIIPAPKNNIPFGYYVAESAIMGAWLAGLTTNWGVWSEGWAWGSIGYDRLFGPQLVGDLENPDFSSMPYNLWLQMKLAGLSQGATVFHFGGESSVVEWGLYEPETGHFVDGDEVLVQSTAFWDMEGNEHPSLRRYVMPFLDAVVSENMIPTREDVLTQVKAAVQAPPLDTNIGSALDYGAYAPLLATTIGLPGYVSIANATEGDPEVEYYELTPNTCRRELLHDQGRYYTIPIVPHGFSSLLDATPVLSLDSMSTSEAVQLALDPLYPERGHNQAWVVQVGERIYINNGLENTDASQSFSLNLNPWGEMSGVVLPHGYILAKSEADRLWIFAHAGTKGPYTDGRTTQVYLPTLDSEAQIEVLFGNAQVDRSEVGAALSLAHDQGAVAVEVIR
jgi:hypothetical protein